MEPSALLSLLNMFGLGLWLAGSAQPWSKRLRRGGLMALTYTLTNLFHFGGHILSSRYAGASMDRVHLAAPFPYAEYLDNDVSPQAHRLRSVGGPLANALACLLSFGLVPLTPANSARREWANVSAWLNGLIALGSLLPLPFIDGGVILKWTLVERGYTPDVADQKVRQANLAVGAVGALVCVMLTLRRYWLAAAGALLTALMAIAAGLGKLR
jgi:hypothetical protein